MSLQFVLGRAGCGKSTYCIDEAVKCEESGKKVLMLVPEQFSHEGENAFLSRKGYIHDGFSVTSFGRLAKKVNQLFGAPHQLLDSSAKAMLVLKALLSVRKDLMFYRTGAEKSGYISLFMDMISEFKKGQVSPDALREAAAVTGDKLFSLRLQDLARIYEAYNSYLCDTLSDGDDELTQMAESVQTHAYMKDTAIFIDAFSRFTQNELTAIRSFLLCGAEVTVTLCLPGLSVSEASVFHGVYRTYQSLLKLAQETDTAVLPPVWLEDTHRFKQPELLTLESALAEKPTEPYSKPPQAISMHVAKGKYEEVTLVASAIRRFVAETGASYKDIAVLTGDYDGYADLVASQFALYEVPVFADMRQDFLSHPIVLYLFSLFELMEGITTRSVISYMKSGFADISINDAAQLENFVLAAGIEYGDWLNDNRFLYQNQGIFEYAEPQENKTDFLTMKTKLLEPVMKLKAQMATSRRISERIEALFTFLEEQEFPQKIDRLATDFRNTGRMRQAEEFTDVYNILVDTLDTMSTLLGEETAGLSVIRSVLEAGLGQKSIGVIPTVYDRVAFGDLNRSVIRNTKALFLLGVNDGVFPPLPQAGALLSDNEREFLNEQGIYVAPDSKRLITDAEFSVYTAATGTGNRLFVSYSLSDSEGHGIRPASIISRIKRLFPNLQPQYEVSPDGLPADIAATSKQSAYHYLLTHMQYLGKNPVADRLHEELSKDPEYREKLERAKIYATYENTAEQLTPDTVKELYGENLYGSVSRFERFAACPFSFFVEYGLNAKERKVLTVAAPDIGTLLHDIIEQFSHRLLSEGKSFRTVTKEEQERICTSITEEMFGAMYAKDIYSAGRLESLKNRMKSLVSKSIWAICMQTARGEFEPTGFEVGFGEKEELPPVTVPLPDGDKIVLSGRIDRIDTLTHRGDLYLKVLDYKSGQKKYSLTDIFNGNTLQLAVYMIAATNGIKHDGDVKFGGMLYFHLDDSIRDGMPSQEAEPVTPLSAYRLTGLVFDNPEIIHAMDADFTGASPVIPVSLNKDGTFSEAKSKLADDIRIGKLKKHILSTIEDIGKEIVQGTVDIYPVRSDKINPCSYCKYIDVCGFDPNVHSCRKLKKFSSDADAWDAME